MVLWACRRISFKVNSLFLSASPPLGPAHPAGPSALVPVGSPCRSTLRSIRDDLMPFRPLSLYPLADKGLGPVWVPLSLYPLAISALSYVPFSRLGPICRRFGPYRSTLWPTAPVGGPYRSTLWPFRRLATYPSYPNRVGHPCPRTFSKFSSLAT
mgnify:CR=1 FL=1